ncbi:hypothetical protein BDN70DRAFT_881153 [Pholiota conissans]|uniref:PARP catalytic domain-containing protein n=1 Tax=Pholiota conissans TaxID=109636 RepID=A0A9P6CZA3_9AGAR|nr:hypothetical protein BDN70DRAFT_881153 [Pholiota conissans]
MAFLQRANTIHEQEDEDPLYDRTFADEDGDEDIIEQPSEETGTYYPGINVCIVCQQRPPHSANGKSYPTCGRTCAKVYDRLKKSIPSSTSVSDGTSVRRFANQRSPATIRRMASSIAGPSRRRQSTIDELSHDLRSLNLQNPPIRTEAASRQRNSCVVCLVGFCEDGRFVTCGIACTEKLSKTGSANPNMCNYCHRRPKVAGKNQCDAGCEDLAKMACLFCKSRPKIKPYHLCGRTCKIIATKSTPLILEAPTGHTTYEFVKKKFKDSWMIPTNPMPIIKHVFKIIEGKEFLQPYDQYKKRIGNEVFRYHGTTRRCSLGSGNNTQLCSNTSCSLCSILRTSFKTSLASPQGAFGPGVYTSSASNKAYSYTSSGSGAIILTKVILGTVRKVSRWNEVMACPPGSHSVVFERENNCLNETIVYSDDAIRPVFLITF